MYSDLKVAGLYRKELKLLLIIIGISFPLSVWKLVDIIIWLFKHIKIGFE